MEPIRILVAGAGGRMGRQIVRCAAHDAECVLVAAVESRGHVSIGRDAGFGADPVGVAITDDWSSSLSDAEAVLDFTTPAASVDIAERAADAGIVHVIGTTGFSKEQESRVAAAAQKTVIIKSGNMSRGANVVAALVGYAARILRDFDVQVV